jgi:tetratricopeptide (TPR) repeat protein
MTRLLRALALAALILLSFDARLAGVRADDVADCLKERGNTQIRGCSRIIKSGHLFGKPISKKTLAVAYNYRGLAYFDKGLHDSAIADYGKAIKLDPKDAKTYYNRGRVYDDKGQYDRAIADFDTAIKINPKLAIVYSNRGSAYDELGQYDRAIADYTQAIKLNPKDARAYYNRGAAYNKKGDKERAIAGFRKVLELRPGNKEGTAALKALGVTP